MLLVLHIDNIKIVMVKEKYKFSKICDAIIFGVVISKHIIKVLLKFQLEGESVFSHQNLTCGEVCM